MENVASYMVLNLKRTSLVTPGLDLSHYQELHYIVSIYQSPLKAIHHHRRYRSSYKPRKLNRKDQ